MTFWRHHNTCITSCYFEEHHWLGCCNSKSRACKTFVARNIRVLQGRWVKHASERLPIRLLNLILANLKRIVRQKKGEMSNCAPLCPLFAQSFESFNATNAPEKWPKREEGIWINHGDFALFNMDCTRCCQVYVHCDVKETVRRRSPQR